MAARDDPSLGGTSNFSRQIHSNLALAYRYNDHLIADSAGRATIGPRHDVTRATRIYTKVKVAVYTIHGKY